MANNLEHLTFKLNGTLASDEMAQQVLDITVDSAMRMPDLCTIRLNDPELKQVSGTDFKIGATLEVVGGLDGSGDSIFAGEITAIEPDFNSEGLASLYIYAYDKSHRLHRGKRSRTFLQQSDDQIIKKMANEAGLKPQVKSTGITHTFMMQNNQTNMEWLQMRAEQLDYQVYVDVSNKLHFVPAGEARGEPVKLLWKEELISFRPRFTTAHQSDEVNVYGWDPMAKKEIKGTAQSNSKLLPAKLKKTGSALAKSAFGAAKYNVVSIPVQDAKAAKSIATGVANSFSDSFAQAEGACFGTSQIVVGGKVDISIEATGLTEYSGVYVVSSLRHIYRATQGRWETHFTISGSRSVSISSLINGNGSDAMHQKRFYGVVPALVTNFKDPEKIGRVKVKFPWLWNDEKNVEIETDWVRVVTPAGGAERGFYFLPEVNDEVLVAFEHGDPNRPFVIGSLWNKKDKPPLPSDKAHDGSKITKRVIKSRSGHTITLDDSNGAEQISIRDKSNKNEIVIDTKNNSILVKCDKDITLDAGGDINVKAKGAVNIESGSDTVVKSSGAFKADGKTGNKITGAKMDIDVKGPMNLKTTAMGELKGNMLKVNGAAMVEVKGGIIKLN